MPDPSPRTPLVDRLSAGLARPFERTPDEHVIALTQRHFGVTPTHVTRLATERDDTFRLTVADDPHGFVLKISPPGEDPAEIELQAAAITHASTRDATLPLQGYLPSLCGEASPDGRAIRLLRYLPGRLLSDAGASPLQWRAVGRMLGRLTAALADFEHPAADRWLAWDLAQLDQLSELVPLLPENGREAVASVLATLAADTLPALRLTSRQVVHNDFHGGNLVVDPQAREFVTGILDFGDVVKSHRSADLAVAMSYAASPPGIDEDPWAGALALAAGYCEVISLGDEETALLPSLALGRLAQRLLLATWLSATRSENAEYTSRNLDSTWRHFLALRNTPLPVGAVGQ